MLKIRKRVSGTITGLNQTLLAAIPEETENELSESESLLNIGKGENSFSQYDSENIGVNNKEQIAPNKTTSVKQTIIASCRSDDDISMSSGNTVENYSMLDIKSLKHVNDFTTDDSTSDGSSTRKQNAILESTENMKSTFALSKVVKKPIKDQIIDFNVPIYITLDKKESTLKPSNVAQCKISKTQSGKDGSLKLKENEKARNNTKLAFPKIKVLAGKFASKHVKNFAEANSFNYIDKSPIDHIDSKCCITETCVNKKELSFLTEKNIVEQQKKNSILNSECLLTELGQTDKKCDCQTYATNTRRRLKPRNNVVNTGERHNIKKSYSVQSEDCVQRDCRKNAAKKQICMPNKLDKGKCCKYCWDHNLDYTNVLDNKETSESSNEDRVLVHTISEGNDICDKDHGKFLNINIICQFFDDNDIKKASIQNSQTSGVFKVRLENNKTYEEHSPGEIQMRISDEKPKNNKLKLLSRLFDSVRIRGKPNKSESSS